MANEYQKYLHQLVYRHISETTLAADRGYNSVVIITPRQAAKVQKNLRSWQILDWSGWLSLSTSLSQCLYPDLQSLFHFINESCSQELVICFPSHQLSLIFQGLLLLHIYCAQLIWHPCTLLHKFEDFLGLHHESYIWGQEKIASGGANQQQCYKY